MVQDWLIEHGKKPYEYQVKLIEGILESENSKIVMAAAPNGGKTTMMICIIDLMLKKNPNLRFLILTHNTIILLDNFKDNIEGLGRPFEYDIITQENKEMNSNVVLGIPSTIRTIEDLPEFDVVIIDEAHEYYEKNSNVHQSSMVQKIIKKVKCKKELLMTGTPSSFNGRDEFDMFYVDAIEAFNSGNSANVYVEISTSSYFVKKTDYTKTFNLKESYIFPKTKTIATLDDVMNKISSRLSSGVRKPKNHIYRDVVDWVFLRNNMGRTLIACNNTKQAQMVGEYFTKNGIKNVVSTHKDDMDNELIRDFIKDQSYKVLIVVRRGILGFSDKTIVNCIDMTLSKNINRMFQLFNRVTRKWGDLNKLFIKVVPSNESDIHRMYVTGMLCMLHKEWYTKFNGRNFNNMVVPRRTRRGAGSGGGSTTRRNRTQQTFEYLDIIDPTEVYQFLTSNKSNVYNTECWVDMKTVVIKLQEYNGESKATHNLTDTIVEEHYAEFEGRTLNELEEKYQSSVTRARTNNYHNELLEKYNITKQYYIRPDEERAKIIVDFCKEHNITIRHQLRNHSIEGRKHYTWIKSHKDIGDQILRPSRIKWTPELVMKSIKEAKQKNITIANYCPSAYGAYKRFKKRGLMR